MVSICATNAQFLAQNGELDAAENQFKTLLQLLPSHPWVLKMYALFLFEYQKRPMFAGKLFRLILSTTPNSSIFASYGHYLWQIGAPAPLTYEAYRISCSFDKEKIYYLANFLGRLGKNENGAKLVEESSLAKHVSNCPEDVSALSTLALAYHQVGLYDKAESLYRKAVQGENCHTFFFKFPYFILFLQFVLRRRKRWTCTFVATSQSFLFTSEAILRKLSISTILPY